MNTKKNYYLMATMVVMSFGLTGCSQCEDVTEDYTGKQAMTFVSGEDTPTRTSMGGKYTDDSFSFYWEGGDAIYVNSVRSNGTSAGISSAIPGNVNGSTAFSQQPHARFTGDVTALRTGGSYEIRYTGTGSYTSNNLRDATYSFTTNSDANTLVIPPVQTIAEADLGTTKNFGAIGDCGIATATGSSSPYSFKLNHKAAYLMLMPRWPGETFNSKTYKLKSVTVTALDIRFLVSGRFSFDDEGIETPLSGTNGSCVIKVNVGGHDGITLPTKTDQDKSINIVIKPLRFVTPLYCIYEVTDGTNTYYIEKIIKDKSFNENTITPITANLEAGYKEASDDGYLDLITNNNIYYNYYEWDVSNSEPYFISHEKSDDYNAITVNSSPSTDFTNVAKNSCANCPTYNEITWYLAGGCYWDANKVWGPSEDQKGGIWFKKKSYLISSGVVADENTFKAKSSGKDLKIPVATPPSDFNLSDWFFLPATGNYRGYPIYRIGTRGYYWTNTPYSTTATAYYLYFDSSYANVYGNQPRSYGFSVWSVQ